MKKNVLAYNAFANSTSVIDVFIELVDIWI